MARAVKELKEGYILELDSPLGRVLCLALKPVSKISWCLLPATHDYRLQLVGDPVLSDDKLPQSPLVVMTESIFVARTVDMFGSPLWGCLSDTSQLSAVSGAGMVMARAMADLSRQQRGEKDVPASNIPCLFPVYTAIDADPFALRRELVQRFQASLRALAGD